MSKLFIAAMLVVLCACSANVAPQDQRIQPNVVIMTVDGQNQPLKVEKVSWWYVKDSGTTYQLQCAEDECSEWILQNQVRGAITVHAHAATVKENDAYCWDWFEGEATLQADPALRQEISITLSHTGTVCK